MANFDKIQGIRDFLGNIIDGSYNIAEATTVYCNTCANGDVFSITPVKTRLIAIRSSCGDLQMSMTDALAGDPPATPAVLLPNADGRVLIPGGQTAPTQYHYIPEGVDTLFFYAKRAGTFFAAFMECPDQFNDSPTA